MNLSDHILPVVLKYEEKGVTEATLRSLSGAGFCDADWIFADRDGVGSMSKAFNRAIRIHELEYEVEEKYIWFITNVTFPPNLPASLFEALESNQKAAAVHPAFNSSHGFINTAKSVTPAHFIEWTAPMVRYSAWEELGELDENMPYVHFDLDWSALAKGEGWQLLIDGRFRLDHTYLHIQQPERISQIRAELRSMAHEKSLAALVDKWGHNWRQELCKGGNCG